MNKLLLCGILALAPSISPIQAQKDSATTNKKNSLYQLTPLNTVDATTVKDQCKTGTCWSFSTLSFFESELIRRGKGDHDLSEMYVVRCAYIEKAINYIRMNGKTNYDQGGEGHDIPYIIAKYGIVPEEVYKGLNYGSDRHNHDEMVALLQVMLAKLNEHPQGKLTPAWLKAVEGVVDAYLGAIPKTFVYRGQSYTPQSFAASLDLRLDDYVMLTSFSHHPLFKPFVIEVPDNWSMQTAYNVPMDALVKTVNTSLSNGISVAWATDVSEKGFSFMDGLAIVPVNDTLIKQKGKDSKYYNEAGAPRSGSAFDQPYPEKPISDSLRQAAFDNQETTDDHGMHITGRYRDQNGKTYYKVKNSWGTNNYAAGYLYASENYFRYKTISILVHKSSIDKNLKEKLNIE